MVANDRTKRALANQLSAPVDRPTVTGTAVAGIACLAGYATFLCPKPADFAQQSTLKSVLNQKFKRSGR